MIKLWTETTHNNNTEIKMILHAQMDTKLHSTQSTQKHTLNIHIHPHGKAHNITHTNTHMPCMHVQINIPESPTMILFKLE